MGKMLTTAVQEKSATTNAPYEAPMIRKDWSSADHCTAGREGSRGREEKLSLTRLTTNINSTKQNAENGNTKGHNLERKQDDRREHIGLKTKD